jgi:hypothetical protein
MSLPAIDLAVLFVLPGGLPAGGGQGAQATSELLAKSLFKMDNSYSSVHQGLLSCYREEFQSLVCDELEDKLSNLVPARGESSVNDRKGM